MTGSRVLVKMPSAWGVDVVFGVPGDTNVPLYITSDIPLAGEGKQTISGMDCQGLFRSVTKWSNVPKSVHKIPETIRRAFCIAASGRF